MSMFGSAITDRFDAASDVDLLVEFEEGRVPGLLRLAGMEIELAPLFGGREIELRTFEDLSHNFRDDVRAMAEPVYAVAT
jgi:predicted nucleotidyltransferase